MAPLPRLACFIYIGCIEGVSILGLCCQLSFGYLALYGSSLDFSIS